MASNSVCVQDNFQMKWPLTLIFNSDLPWAYKFKFVSKIKSQD